MAFLFWLGMSGARNAVVRPAESPARKRSGCISSSRFGTAKQIQAARRRRSRRSIPLISTKTKSHSVRNGFFVLAGHTWREKRCGSTECIFAAQKRRFFCMQCRKHKKMQSARRRRSRRSIPLIVPLSFLEKRMHFFSHAT